MISQITKSFRSPYNHLIKSNQFRFRENRVLDLTVIKSREIEILIKSLRLNLSFYVSREDFSFIHQPSVLASIFNLRLSFLKLNIKKEYVKAQSIHNYP